MRRLLVFCAVMVTIFAAFAAVRLTRVPTVWAAAGPGSLEFNGFPVLAGCPLGPAITFCNQIPGTTGNEQAGFQIKAINAVSGVSVSVAPIPGMTANLAASCATPGGACDFTIVTNSCTGTLASGASCNLTVTFTPTTSGLREAALTITDAAGDTLSVNIEGTAAPLSFLLPGPLVCPGQLPDNAFQYCSEAVGASSGSQTFTLVSANAVTGLNVTIAGESGLASEFNGAQPDFTITGTTCGGTLPAFTDCAVGVAFTPKTAGLRAAALTATDSEGDVVTILLAGSTSTGLTIQPAGGSVPNCTLPPGNDFCNEPTAGSTASQAYTLTNTSGTQITGLVISPPLPSVQPPPPPVNFTVTSTSCPATLAAGASCTINVAFTPLATGLQQGSVTATDTQGDVSAINLSGTGDDFNLAIVANQSPEVTVSQGNTATFMAQLNADSVFGQNGEMVTMSCPINLPAFTTCAYMPCPITPVIGGSVPFSILIATSTATVLTPEVPNPCNNPNAASSVPGTRGPNGFLRIVTNQPVKAPQFPALLAVFLTLALLLAALGLTATSVLPAFGPGARRALVAFALIAFSSALLSACGKKSNVNSTATPVGSTIMVVPAQAVDSNGNSINAGRGLQITLDVIKQVRTGPIP